MPRRGSKAEKALRNLEDETRRIARSARPDIEEWLSLSREERRERWMGMTQDERLGLVQMYRSRKNNGDWGSDEECRELVREGNLKYGLTADGEEIPTAPAAAEAPTSDTPEAPASDDEALTAFQSLSREEQAAHWLSIDAPARRRLIEMALRKRQRETGQPFGEANIQAAMERYDRRYQEIAVAVLRAPTPDATVVKRLVEMADSARSEERSATAKRERTYFKREANAFDRALEAYLRGMRPRFEGGIYVLPSQRPNGAPHRLHLAGDWQCTCGAKHTMHWAKALVVAWDAIRQPLTQAA